jgi:hypothetical protein
MMSWLLLLLLLLCVIGRSGAVMVNAEEYSALTLFYEQIGCNTSACPRFANDNGERRRI